MKELDYACYFLSDSEASFRLEKDSVLIAGEATEPRQHWLTNLDPKEHCKITAQYADRFDYVYGGKTDSVALRSSKQPKGFVHSLGNGAIILDITSLSHHTWAPILRAALAESNRVMVTYVEPEAYKSMPTEDDVTFYDLSERIQGISPIPGFITLEDRHEDDVCFIPLLGFEGARFSYILEETQPPSDKIVPIVGIPGFRPEFPFETFERNQGPLMSTKGWRKVRYASANNPFSLFAQLSEIADEYKDALLQIAPIGTKPHALGSLIFALKSRRQIEFVYDHPIRKQDRSRGIGKILTYYVSEFVNDL